MPRKTRMIGGSRGTIKTIFRLLAFCSPRCAREAPAYGRGASIVYCFCTFEKILSFSGPVEIVELVKNLNKIREL